MQYPLISEYVKAIQDAGDNLEQLAHLTPVLDDHGEPYRSSGAFAVVFKMQDRRSGKYYALKCFTEEQQGRAEAYRQIADELGMLASSYITSVKYIEKELFVDSNCEEEEFPVLLMDWVDGETMEAYIATNYQNQPAMSMLSYRFGKMAAWLRTQSFAHGDIKPDNIIVRPDGSLTLVDYDGMFVPSMKGSQSPTISTRDFSHPLRTVDDFDETVDDFSLASIALSLKAISMKSTLLDIYGASDRLLFSENDYRNPSNSKVISALQELMCDKDFCTLYSLFMLALARKELSACSFRLFIGEKPNITPVMNEDLSTETTKEELKEAIVDERGVKYSKDGRKLLKATEGLSGAYSVKEGTRIICDSAFSWCRSLSEIVIPASVTSIGYRAFSDCYSLSEIVIPSSVTSIGDSAFSLCTSLKYISISKSVICFNGNPFAEWNGKLECLSPNYIYEDDILFNKDKSGIISFRNQNIKSYVIPSSVTSIGNSAFGGCHSLCKIVIPSSVTSIGDSAFGGCRSLSEIVIPSSVTSIGDRAFGDCSSLSEIVIPSSVTSIGDRAFYSCTSLIYISIPKSVICLNGNPFAEWNGKLECLSPNYIYEDDILFNKDKSGIISFRNQNIKSYVIPSSVTSIGNSAFGGCRSLSEIVISSSVTSIGNWAFNDCHSLCKIVIPSSVTSIGNSAFSWCESLSKIVIPSSVTSIGDSVFSWCSSLSEIVIPSSVTSIGYRAFSNCQSLSKIVIPSSVTSIGNWAFNDCYSLSEIVIPSSVTSIGNSAFNDCYSLSEIVIPSSVTSIGDSAFSGCSSLSKIVIPSSVTSIGDWAFSDCRSLSEIVIPSSVTSIGDSAFWRCYSLTYISISKSVICLNGNPFYSWNGKLECLSPNFVYEDDVLFNKDKSRIISFRNRNVESYVIPSSVTNIGDSAFSGCDSLSEIVIPSSVTSIGRDAFYGCSSLSEIVIPASVTSIGDSAFEDCSFLSEIVIPSSVTSIGNCAFSDCRSLSKIVIPSSVTSIGNCAFSDCRFLSKIVIPSSVTSIDNSAFENCSFLSKIVIPSSVTSIGDRAFRNCNFPSDLKQELISRFGDIIF